MALSEPRACSLALTRTFSCRAPWLQVPMQPTQRPVDSISQASSTSSFSSTLARSRREKPKKDYREVRLPDGRADGMAALCHGSYLKNHGMVRAAQ